MKFAELKSGKRGLVRGMTDEKVLVQLTQDETYLLHRELVKRFLYRDKRRKWQRELLEKLGVSG